YGQAIKWHRNLSFIYAAFHEGSNFEQNQEMILSKGLNVLKFVTKPISFLHQWKPPQCRKNQAVLHFDLSKYIHDWGTIPEKYQQFDQWIWDEDKGRFTGPFITLYPNTSNYCIDRYPQPNLNTNVVRIYNLLCNNMLVLFKWRSFLLWNSRMQ
ncbi:unnamed protein product, partial [Adineta ricciae]